MSTTKQKKRIDLDSMRILPKVLLIPSLIIIAVVFLYPMLYSLAMSFHQVNVSDQSWVLYGLKNYIALFKDKLFLKSCRITAEFTLLSVSFEMVVGTLMAVLLNQKFRGRGFVRGIMIIPWALPTVVNAIMWKWIFNANYGAFNAMLSKFGLISEYHNWLGQPVSAFFCVLFANIWKETPYVVLLVLAGLQSIPSELYESANVDGCHPVKAFFSITVPMLKNILVILLITKTIWTIQTYDVISIMTGGGPANATQLIAYYVQKTTFKFFDFGGGSAMSYVILFVTFILSLLYIKVTAKNGEEF